MLVLAGSSRSFFLSGFLKLEHHRLGPTSRPRTLTRLRNRSNEDVLSEPTLPTKILVESFHNSQLITASARISAARKRETTEYSAVSEN